MTVLAAFSSACATDARLTNPTAANPAVHLLTFIVPPMFICWFRFLPKCISEDKSGLPSHTTTGAFVALIGKNLGFDNRFFGLFFGLVFRFVRKECTKFGQLQGMAQLGKL